MSPAMDGRRRRWVALDVEFTATPLGARLLGEFGNEGLLVWVALLAAAKRSPIEGTVRFHSEADLWGQLGIEAPPFPIDRFLMITGRLKETRRRTQGRATYVRLTRWEDLQQMTRRALTDVRQTPNTSHSEAETATSENLFTSGKSQTTRPDQTRHDKTPTGPDNGAGIDIAVEEVKRENDPTIRSVEKVARHRYNQRPGFYDGEAMKRQRRAADLEAIAECPKCDDQGLVDIDNDTRARCSHVSPVSLLAEKWSAS